MLPIAILNLIVVCLAELSGKPLLANWIGFAILLGLYVTLGPVISKKLNVQKK
jgi:hypothetical protein